MKVKVIQAGTKLYSLATYIFVHILQEIGS